MSRLVLSGLSGANPLGFLGALGLLRILGRRGQPVRLGFLADGSYHPFVEGGADDVAVLAAEDAGDLNDPHPWLLTYEKQEKKALRVVADLKAPPAVFASFLTACVERWIAGEDEPAAYAAAFGTSVAVDGNGNTKPTAFHFTAANQQFLGIVLAIRKSVTTEWARRSLFEGHSRQPGSNLRWDPAAERNWALMANDPNDEGTTVDAPLEWLAFRGLPLFATVPAGKRVLTTTITRRGGDMMMTWPLWSTPASLATVRSLLQLNWSGLARDRAMRGVFAVCNSEIRRTSQGFGNFGPASVVP